VRLLAAEAFARLRRLPEAREQLAAARTADTVLQSNPLLKMREIRVRLWLGEVGNLAPELAACADSLKDDPANLALLACEEGRAWDAHGDLTRAEQCWQRAERLSRDLGRDPVRADILVQLGRLEHLRGHLQPALDRYDAALACARAGTPQSQEIQLRKLLVLLDLNQWGQARTEFARLFDDPAKEPVEEVRGLVATVSALLGEGSAGEDDYELRGYQAASRGDQQAAREAYRRALEEAPSPARRARLALALGMLALASADRAEAAAWLRQAEETARALDLPEVLWRSLQARGQLSAELDGDDRLARTLFEEAVLVSEKQARQLRYRADAAAYHLHRSGVLRQLSRAACRRGEAAAAFRYQELDRGRLLLDLWRSAAGRPGRAPLLATPELADLDRQLEACDQELAARPDDSAEPLLQRREELLVRRDRLFDEYLRDHSRRGDAALPALPELEELERALPPGTVYVAPTLAEEDLHLLVVRRGTGGTIITAPGTGGRLRRQLDDFRRCLTAQVERYRSGLPMGRPERDELDGRLTEFGRGPLGSALGQLLDTGSPTRERLVWVPDGELHGLPVHALRLGGRYLIEQHEVVHTFGGALLVHQAKAKPRRGGRAVVVTESESVLPTARREGEGVAGAFFRKRILAGAGGSRDALRRQLPKARVAHFACHAYFDVRHPLAAAVGLPSEETWRALEWLDEPLDGLPLVTLSACRSAEVAPLVGREVFGLVTGLLGSGVRAVLAGLWPVADEETLPLMWLFYRHRLTADLATALARAQRQALADPGGSPLYWAPFALFGDAAALPAPGRWWRWWARWRQRRHARRFPVPLNPSATEPES
jgi:tetratricopeptide (TPR) repeat protein